MSYVIWALSYVIILDTQIEDEQNLMVFFKSYDFIAFILLTFIFFFYFTNHTERNYV